MSGYPYVEPPPELVVARRKARRGKKGDWWGNHWLLLFGKGGFWVALQFEWTVAHGRHSNPAWFNTAYRELVHGRFGLRRCEVKKKVGEYKLTCARDQHTDLVHIDGRSWPVFAWREQDWKAAGGDDSKL